jgi:hypothetical protein
MLVYLVGALAVLVAIETYMLWRVGRALVVLEHFSDRIGQFGGALQLLTDTAETGFSSFASVLSESMTPPPRPKTSRRRRPMSPPPPLPNEAPSQSHSRGSALRLSGDWGSWGSGA